MLLVAFLKRSEFLLMYRIDLQRISPLKSHHSQPQPQANASLHPQTSSKTLSSGIGISLKSFRSHHHSKPIPRLLIKSKLHRRNFSSRLWDCMELHNYLGIFLNCLHHFKKLHLHASFYNKSDSSTCVIIRLKRQLSQTVAQHHPHSLNRKTKPSNTLKGTIHPHK